MTSPSPSFLGPARRCLLSGATVIIAAALVGCSAQANQWNLVRMLNLPEYADETDGPVEEWIEDAGVEARADQTTQTQYDPLGLREVFMSDKARSIERNLGIE